MTRAPTNVQRITFVGAPFDLASKDAVLATLAETDGSEPFAYVVTPNVGYVVLIKNDPTLRPVFEGAWMSWCDSHQIERIARLFGFKMPHLNGTDVMMRLFSEVLLPGDRIACIVANAKVGEAMVRTFPQYQVVWHTPPVGFIESPAAVEECIAFVERAKARFIFFGVGAPQSERLAYLVQQRGTATGTAFCIGAALEFLTSRKARAPQWMQTLGLEWLHRLISEPRRLWRRYVFSAVPFATLVYDEIRQRFLSPRRVADTRGSMPPGPD
jgi:N-acetylglucosaminyldiphosphoundecaprenol N-acetyl-beta-D-mannosaminyltransferase